MIQSLLSNKPSNILDVKDEYTSSESKINHISYYTSLSKVISDIQKEKDQEEEPAIKSHLDNRIDAMERDRERIRKMFPDIKEEEWNGNTN